MESKKHLIIISTITILLFACIGGYFLLNKNGPNVETLWGEYIAHINEGSYEELYPLISKASQELITEEDFVKRNQRIYDGIGASNLEISDQAVEKEGANHIISYQITMQTDAGEYREQNSVTMVKEDDTYKVEWSSNLIFKELDNDDTIAINTIEAKRGDILDRNDNILATNGNVMQIGIVPGKMENKAETISTLASRLEISTSEIEKALSASWVQDDVFVPIKTVTYDEQERSKFSDIAGVQIQTAKDRVYPYGKTCAHITGYVQSITAEELEKHPDEEYHQNSIIGKSGLEAIYESKLRGEDGYQIAINHGENSSVVIESEKKDGENIKTTIDMEVQNVLYNTIKNDPGAAVAMNPKTGEMLALVSSPAYDPNQFVLGMDTETWNSINNDTNQPLRNRFISAYVPGSTFKAITGAIGLDTGTISNDTEYKKVANWKWQKDSSWGDYYVPTTHEYNEPSNLENAMIYSDNIYFAQLADQIGSNKFTSYLKQLGFQEDIEFPYTIDQASYGSEEDINNSMTLAVSGFGQGKIEVSPIHLTDIYTAFVNEGSMVQPYLIYEDGAAKLWKEHVFTADTANTIRADLIKAMNVYGDNPTNAGAKTGTAEVGNSEIGWITGIRDDIAITFMVDNTKDKGGSAYNMPMLINALKEIQ